MKSKKTTIGIVDKCGSRGEAHIDNHYHGV